VPSVDIDLLSRLACAAGRRLQEEFVKNATLVPALAPSYWGVLGIHNATTHIQLADSKFNVPLQRSLLRRIGVPMHPSNSDKAH
jgi:hypothetical protein